MITNRYFKNNNGVSWVGRNVVVTGACGFIGSHLVERLVALGANVKALALYDARGGHGWLADVSDDVKGSFEIVSGDVRDAGIMQSLIQKDDVVFHLAALIGIPYSYVAPRSYVDTNINGTVNVLEAARTNCAGKVMVVSTSEVYGTAVEVPINEDHPLQAQSPYSASKIAAEKMSESYCKSFEMPVTVIRPFNTYGPRQSARAVIPTIIMQLLGGRETISLGDASTVRDFNYVDDTVMGMVYLAESDDAVGKTVNIGSGVEITIGETAKLAGKALGCDVQICSESARMRPSMSEVRRLCAGNSLLKSLTGFVPETPLEEGISRTADWMRTRQQCGQYEMNRYYV